MSTPKELTGHIESKVPLIPAESEHHWQVAILTGCGVCGTHEGYECLNCQRVVDYQCDQDLAAAIGMMLAQQVLG